MSAGRDSSSFSPIYKARATFSAYIQCFFKTKFSGITNDFAHVSRTNGIKTLSLYVKTIETAYVFMVMHAKQTHKYYGTGQKHFKGTGDDGFCGDMH